MRSEGFVTQDGLREGEGWIRPRSVLSIHGEYTKAILGADEKIQVGYRYLQRIKIAEVAFADDVVLTAENEKNLQDSVDI
ncbi:hypothetical protein Trydic_g6075 [Trypoxylus dichotomus]